MVDRNVNPVPLHPSSNIVPSPRSELEAECRRCVAALAARARDKAGSSYLDEMSERLAIRPIEMAIAELTSLLVDIGEGKKRARVHPIRESMAYWFDAMLYLQHGVALDSFRREQEQAKKAEA